MILIECLYYIPVIKISSLFTRRPKNMISIVLIRHNKEVIDSFEMLFQDHGQFRDVLFQVWNWSRKANAHKNPQGTKTNTVLWKHGVKSGLWQYRLWSFQTGGYKIWKVFDVKNVLYTRQHNLKPIYWDFFSENWRKFLMFVIKKQ